MNALSFGTVNTLSFGNAARRRSGIVSDESRPDKPIDVAWIVLEAANDLGDESAVEACRRVIDASLNGRPAPPSDLHIVLDYFR
jgi:hypothetical protein